MYRIATILLVAAAAAAGDDLERALGAVRAQGAPAVAAVLELEPSAADVIAAARTAVPPAPLAPGLHARAAAGRPYELFVPAGTTGRIPLVVHMHGGVARADYPESVARSGMGARWNAAAAEHGFAVLYPHARRDCMWWTDAGTAHVRACIRDAKRVVAVDDDAVFGTGFSDGASGCFHLALAAPEPFAGFLALNGHPAVPATASGKQLYLRNLKATPLLVATTRDDQLYPAHSLFPHLEHALRFKAPVHVLSYPTGGHQPVYWDEYEPHFARFLADVRRAPPAEIDWWCADAADGRVHWAEILELGATARDAAALTDANVISTPGRVRLGVQLGTGTDVVRVVEDSNAARMGLRAGDVIVALQGEAVGDRAALGAALAGVEHGGELVVRVQRGDEEIECRTRVPEFTPRPYYARAKPTARLTVRVEDGALRIVSRNVKRARFRLPRTLFPGAVRIAVNGREIEAEPASIDVAALLADYAEHADGGRLFERSIVMKTE